jgi:hypothetical protein
MLRRGTCRLLVQGRENPQPQLSTVQVSGRRDDRQVLRRFATYSTRDAAVHCSS